MEKLLELILNINFIDIYKEEYLYQKGSSASGIDFPNLNVDMKVTSIKQPQSSCP